MTGFIGATRGGVASVNTTSVPVTCHTSTQVGDRTVLILMLRGSRSAPTMTVPTGWTQISALFATGAGTTSGNIQVFEKVATVAGAQTDTFTKSTTGIHSYLCVTLRNAQAGVVRGSGTATTATSLTTAAITTAAASEFVLRMVGGAFGTAAQETPVTWDAACTPILDVQGAAADSTGLAFASASYEVGPSPAGSVVGRSISLPNAPTASATVSIAFPAPTAPANTSAPVASGTAAVGSVLTSTGGAWDQTVTTSYQWQRDTVDISGATASTYTVATADAGHSLRCVVTATSSGGATAANSNAVAIPAAPVNTVAPALSRVGGGTTYATGDTVTCDTGTWTGTGLAYTYQWYRGTSPITGETAAAYTLVVTDEGANISCRVTASNGGGSATANSNTIVPAVTAPLSDASFLDYYSGGSANTDPALSIGGARGGTYPGGLNKIIGPILGSVAQAGGVFYVDVYIRNTHTTATAASCKLFIEQQFANAGLHVAAAVPAAAVNTALPTRASLTTAPAGITSWTTATVAASGLDFGNLGPGDYRGVHLRFTVDAGTTMTSEDDFTVAVQGSAA